MAEVRGVLTCGEFSAVPLLQRPHEYEITCRQLPGWSHLVIGAESLAADAIIRLQAEFRGSWAAEEESS